MRASFDMLRFFEYDIIFPDTYGIMLPPRISQSV